jgi:hypothetical protein
MAYLKITRYGCRPLGYGPLALGGEPVLAWRHIATGIRVFTCPEMPGFGWHIEGDDSDAFSSSLRAVAARLERRIRA